jgi:WG containing repeat
VRLAPQKIKLFFASVLLAIVGSAVSTNHADSKFAYFDRQRTGLTYGFIDKTGRFIIPPKFSKASSFDATGIAMVEIKSTADKNWYTSKLIDINGRMTPGSDEIDVLSLPKQSLAVSQWKDKGESSKTPSRKGFTYCSTEGKIFKRDFQSAGDFGEGVAIATTHGMTGFVHSDGTFQPIQTLTGCDVLGEFANGLAPIRQHGKSGYIDKTGNWLIKPIFRDAQVFSEGLARVQYMPTAASIVDHRLSPNSIRWGLIDTRGKWVIPPRYLEIGPLKEGLRYFRDGDLIGYMDRNGKIAIPAKFSQAGSFSEGLAPVCLQDSRTLVFIDRAGKIILSRDLKDPVRITDEWPTFRQGLCAMYQEYKCESRWGFIDKENHWKIEPLFKEVKSFSGEYAVAGVKIK